MMSSPDASRRTKIVVIIPGLEVGGAEQDIVRNFPRLDRHTFEVVVVSFSSMGVLGAELQRQGIRVESRLEQEAAEAARRPSSRRHWPWRRDSARPAPAAVVRLRRVFRGTPGIARCARSTARWVQTMVRLPGRVFGVLGRPVRWGAATHRASAFASWMRMRAATVRYILRVILWLRRTLAAERADVAHFFLPYSYIYGMAASWLVWPRPKRVMSRLSLNFYQQSHKIAGWVEHVLHGTLDVAVGNSERILDDLRKEGVPVPRLRLLYNGIDPQPFERHEGDRARARAALNIQDASFMMLAVGNLHVYKGHAELLEACALALPALPARWLLCVAGQDVGGNRAVYERRVADLRLGHHVLFMGGRDDIARLLQAADLLVHPSHHEGLPNAIIEAMAASLPVVATRVGGIPELVVPRADRDATGWLVPPRHPEALAKALVEAAGDDDGRVAMGIRARARVAAHFSLERSVSSYEAIYRELVPRTGES